MRASRYSRKRSNFDVTRRGLRSAGASPWSSRRTVFRSRPVTRAISLMLFPLTQASWMSMNSPRPTISRDLLLQRELLQQEPRTPGLGWGISDRRYLGSFTPALTQNGNFGGSQPLLLALNGICVHSLGSILSVARGCTQVRMRRSVPGIPGRLGPAQSPNDIAFLDVIC